MSTLSSEEWQKLSPYLDDALGMKDDERGVWLAGLRDKDPALASLLESLLREHQALAQKHFLEQGPLLSSPAGMTGQTLGAYTLISPVGEGGMGSVWLADRNDGRFDRRVAVKLLRIPLLGRAGGERFQREGAILARLAHSHIAQLLDAGVASSGQPYLILEYVEGEDIVTYCDRRRLDVDARLQLFLGMLDAVAHAHANLIVHRDIKPSNVYVNRDGQVKLLDFGIAKLLEAEGGEGAVTRLTREGGGALTPQYAAPEQVTGGPVTVATDVYASGVLLYLLLTGKHPAGTGLHSPAELVKAIVETETVRPSDVLVPGQDPTEVLVETAAKRATTPDKLRRQLRGDLDTIIRKALKKSPAERYGSVSALADDLRRYLKHEPISARPDTVAYRTAKFIRRNRYRVAAGVLALTAIVAGFAVALYQARLAQRRFQEVRKLAHTFVFDLYDDVAKLEGSTKTREMMVRTGLQYLDNLAKNSGGDPGLQEEIAAAYLKIGDAQGHPTRPNLGRMADALASYRKAGDIYQRLAAKNQTYLRDLAVYYLSYAGLVRFTDLTQAKQFSEAAIQTFDRLRSQQPLDAELQSSYTSAWCTVGDIDEDGGHYRQAWTEFSRCAELARVQLSHQEDPPSLSAVAQAEERVGTAAQELGLFQESLRAFDEDESTLKKLLAAEPLNPRFHRMQAVLHQFRSRLYFDDRYPNLGDPARALESATQYLHETEEMVRSDPNNTAAQTSRAFAACRVSYPLREIDPRAAVRMARDAVRMFDELTASGKTDSLIISGRAQGLRLLGEAQLKAGQVTAARRSAESALAAWREIAAKSARGSEDRVELVHTLILAGEASIAASDLARAQNLLAEARDEAQPIAGHGELTDLIPLARAEEALGTLYTRERRTEEARACYERRVELWQRFPESNEYVDRQKAASKELLARTSHHV